jgi:peptide/nickel transport system permease protein
MNELSAGSIPTRAGKIGNSASWRFARYFFTRLITILATIFVSMFIVVLIMNQSGFIDDAVDTEIRTEVPRYFYGSPDFNNLSPQEQSQVIENETAKWIEQSGLNLPYWPRQLRWTWNILTFDWNEIRGTYGGSEFEPPKRTFWALTGDSNVRQRALSIVLQYFPNTLLVIGVAFLLVFLIGLPLALRLSIRYGSRLDKLLAALGPLSSVPSWAYGVLLVSIFAFQLHWLPSRGMTDVVPAKTGVGIMLGVARHMILPVTTIVLSMFFQVVYSWRSYFILNSEEDYVDTAHAKGLAPRLLERRYILRPTLPYVLTSFALMLLGFWQLTTALEYYFNWPGIGFLYIQALQTGDLIVSVGIVMIFAYLLGAIMLILDLICAILDPRIRLGTQPSLKIHLAKKSERIPALARTSNLPREKLRSPRLSIHLDLRQVFQSLGAWFKRMGRAVRSVFRELLYYPSAAIGLGLIALFLIGSLAAIVPIVRRDAAFWERWYYIANTQYYRPAYALPAWVNWFRVHKLPETQIFDSRIGTSALKLVEPNKSGGSNIAITYTFTLPDGDFPEDIRLYYYTDYSATMPFVTPVLNTPDGREIVLKSGSIFPGELVSLSDSVPRRYLNNDYQKAAWIAQAGVGGYLPFFALLKNPAFETPAPLAGTYTLRLNAITFDSESTLDAELVILGKVYGAAGTDNQRRDLSIPLLTGLPVALGIGLLGAFITTFLSMLIAAVGVWFGGWLDTLTQRLTELNMILPILAIGVMLYYYFQVHLLVIVGIVVLLNAFGGTTKAYRAAFLQIKESPYIEAARSYGASNTRIIFRYLIPRILPVLVPQLVSLIPGYVFLEATLSMLGVCWMGIPTWGGIIFEALRLGAYRGHYFWVLQPVVLLLLMGLAFSMVGFALDRILNPRLRSV